MPRDVGDISRTFAKLVEAELRERFALDEIDDLRRAKAKSPVVVQLVWDGGSALEPGRVVKLGTALHDPAADATAPYSGLKFNCTSFAAADTSRGYAIALGPIAGGGSGVGYGVIPESSWAKVNVTDAGHGFAKIITAGTLFDSHAADGLPILWKQSGTGEKWAVVLLAPTTTNEIQVPLRRFELTATKTLLQNTATVRWLDDAGEMTGSPLTIYDPQHGRPRFAGHAAGYNSEEPGFVGDALLRMDLGGVEPDRWEIVNMEGIAERIRGTVKFDDSSGPAGGYWLQFDGVLSMYSWNCRNPVEPGGRLELYDATSPDIYTPNEGDQVLAELVDVGNLADELPVYRVYSVRQPAVVIVAIESSRTIGADAGETWIKPQPWNLELLEWNEDLERYELQGRFVKTRCFDTSEFKVENGKKYIGFGGRDATGEVILHTIVCTPFYKPES